MVLNRFLYVLSDTLRLSIRVVPLKCKEGHMRFSCSGQGIVMQCRSSKSGCSRVEPWWKIGHPCVLVASLSSEQVYLLFFSCRFGMLDQGLPTLQSAFQVNLILVVFWIFVQSNPSIHETLVWYISVFFPLSIKSLKWEERRRSSRTSYSRNDMRIKY